MDIDKMIYIYMAMTRINEASGNIFNFSDMHDILKILRRIHALQAAHTKLMEEKEKNASEISRVESRINALCNKIPGAVVEFSKNNNFGFPSMYFLVDGWLINLRALFG